MRRQLNSAIAGLLLLIVVTPAVGGTYHDPTGFSFTYPDGWTAVTKPGPGINNALPPETDRWVKDKKVDLNRLAVSLIRNGRDPFLENLNVVVEHRMIAVNDDSLKSALAEVLQAYRQMGVSLEGIDGRVGTVGGKQAIFLEYRVTIPGVPSPLKQKQVFIPGGGKTFIVTCTATTRTQAQYAPTFDAILASFRVPASELVGVEGNRNLIEGVIEVAIGVLVALVVWFITARKRQAQSARSSETH